jgi:hypothetical protein
MVPSSGSTLIHNLSMRRLLIRRALRRQIYTLQQRRQIMLPRDNSRVSFLAIDMDSWRLKTRSCMNIEKATHSTLQAKSWRGTTDM